jgi:hypothetical protein
MIFIDSIDYHILCDGKAVVQSCNQSITALLPRSCVIVNGAPAIVTHLRLTVLTGAVQTVLIPHSLHTMCSFDLPEIRKLEYLVFESGTKLRSIASAVFACSGLRSLFLPSTVRIIGTKAFANCESWHSSILVINVR